MKKITKILISLFASTMVSLSAFAGELTVTGTAKATYNTVSGAANGDNTLGVANEFTIGAAGELENGWTWTYALDMDPADTAAGGAALNDDSALTLSTRINVLPVSLIPLIKLAILSNRSLSSNKCFNSL